MKSYNESSGSIEYKSSLELNAFRYADFNKHIVRFSVEPFNIKYLKPSDGLLHRYYVDMFLEFEGGHKFIVEIKSFNETILPKKSKKFTQKRERNYNKSMQTYAINTAKWDAARKFAELNNMQFIILTEKELK